VVDRARDNDIVHVLPRPDGWALAHAPDGRSVGLFLNRQFAIRAGQALATRVGAQLVVHGPDGAVDAVVGVPERRRSPRTLLGRRRRSRTTTGAPSSADGAVLECLLDVRVPYDSWCLRVVRTACERTLAPICPRALLDEAQMVVTELVLQTTLRNRSDCRLIIHLLDHEILVEVRSVPPAGAPDDSVERASAWARFDLRHGSDIEREASGG
jgi:hypothetical protein